MRPLESLYKNALKIHDKKTCQYYNCKILDKHNFLNFENCIVYANVHLMFKIIHNAAPPPLRNFVTLGSEFSARATRAHRAAVHVMSQTRS